MHWITPVDQLHTGWSLQTNFVSLIQPRDEHLYSSQIFNVFLWTGFILSTQLPKSKLWSGMSQHRDSRTWGEEKQTTLCVISIQWYSSQQLLQTRKGILGHQFWSLAFMSNHLLKEYQKAPLQTLTHNYRPLQSLLYHPRAPDKDQNPGALGASQTQKGGPFLKDLIHQVQGKKQ